MADMDAAAEKIGGAHNLIATLMQASVGIEGTKASGNSAKTALKPTGSASSRDWVSRAIRTGMRRWRR
jgi:hypothetical protein